MQNLHFSCLTPSNRNVIGSNWHWVFGSFATMRQFTNHLFTASCSWLWVCSTKPPYLHSRSGSQWLIICSEIYNIFYVEPGLQTTNRLKLLLKRGLKDRREFFFQEIKQFGRKVPELCQCCRRLYWKMAIRCMARIRLLCHSTLYDLSLIHISEPTRPY